MRRLLAVLVLVLLPTSAWAQSETVEYYGLDALGSVRVIFDGQGTVVDRMDYGPFGENLRAAIKFPTEQFAQLARDPESGQDYAQARTYSPTTGRFNRVDPVYAGLFEPQGWNRYSYSLNNPAGYVDPNGRDPILAGALAVAGAVATLERIGMLDPNRSTTATGDAGEIFYALPAEDEFLGNDGWLGSVQVTLDITSIALDVTGVGAVVSPVLDLANAAISLSTGDLQGAGLSATAAIPFVGSAANATRIGRWTYTNTVANHLIDITRHGDLARPYMNSPHTIEEIMRATRPIPDPGGAPNVLRWDVPGSFNGSDGLWELVVDPNTMTILHFVFIGSGR